MKTRLLWIAIMSVGLTALYFGIARPHVSTIPKALRDPLADVKPPMPPPPELPPLAIPPIPTLAPPPLKAVSIGEPVLSPPGTAKRGASDAKK